MQPSRNFELENWIATGQWQSPTVIWRKPRKLRQRDARKAANLREYQSQLSPAQQKYAEYLQSLHWKTFRLSVLAERGARCEDCGSVHQVQVHHQTYARLGHEFPTDVVVLCK